jgi:hypothetical protein
VPNHPQTIFSEPEDWIDEGDVISLQGWLDKRVPPGHVDWMSTRSHLHGLAGYAIPEQPECLRLLLNAGVSPHFFLTPALVDETLACLDILLAHAPLDASAFTSTATAALRAQCHPALARLMWAARSALAPDEFRAGWLTLLRQACQSDNLEGLDVLLAHAPSSLPTHILTQFERVHFQNLLAEQHRTGAVQLPPFWCNAPPCPAPLRRIVEWAGPIRLLEHALGQQRGDVIDWIAAQSPEVSVEWIDLALAHVPGAIPELEARRNRDILRESLQNALSMPALETPSQTRRRL